MYIHTERDYTYTHTRIPLCTPKIIHVCGVGGDRMIENACVWENSSHSFSQIYIHIYRKSESNVCEQLLLALWMYVAMHIYVYNKREYYVFICAQTAKYRYIYAILYIKGGIVCLCVREQTLAPSVCVYMCVYICAYRKRSREECVLRENRSLAPIAVCVRARACV